MDDILKDPRFASIATDPKFKNVPKAHRKVKIDKRFQSIFTDERFQVKYSVDKTGRPVNETSSENFRKYYELSSDEEESDSEDEEINKETKVGVASRKSKTEVEKVSKKSKSREKLSKKLIEEEKYDERKNKSISDNEDEEEVESAKDNRVKHVKSKKFQEEFDKSESNEESDDDDEETTDPEKSIAQLDSASKRSKLPNDIREKLHDLKVDYARGMSTLMSDSSSDEATDEELEEGSEEELEHNWGELDRDADVADSATHRLAICNMDWDRIRAVDLMVLCSSFLPSGGHVKSITIYPSEFGLKRMKEEELKGPIELVKEKVDIRADDPNENDDCDDGDDNSNDDEESKEGSKYHMERLRQYQLNRLKYYYAVVVCDSVETASKLYSECDGMEYESSSTRLDLRFIPDDVTFDEEPKEVCTEIQDMTKYEPRFFVNTALQQGKVSCTWDETDPARTQLAEKLHQMKGGADNLNDEELQIFLASSSGEDEDENDKIINYGNDESEDNSSQENGDDSSDDNKGSSTNKSIDKYRSLLNKIQENEEKKKNRDVEMEITWGVGLKEKAQTLVEQKLKEKSELTPFEKIIEKRKEKRKQKKEEKMKKKKAEKLKDDGTSDEDGGNNDALFSDDEIPDDIDLNDDYFKDEFDQKDTSKNKKKKNKKKSKNEDLNDEEKLKRDELELLLFDDEDKDGNLRKSHFNFKEIQATEENDTKKKRKKGRKQIIKNNKRMLQDQSAAEDDFKVDVTDDRFTAVFTSHHFNIDPADSHYRKTKGMDAFIKEKINRKYKASSDQDQETSSAHPPPSKVPKLDADLSKVISSIKKKTKGLK